MVFIVRVSFTVSVVRDRSFGKRSDTRGFCKLIRASETGLVNWSRRFSDRMFLMIGNFNAALRDRASFVRRRVCIFFLFSSSLHPPSSVALPLVSTSEKPQNRWTDAGYISFPQLNPSNLYGNYEPRLATKRNN